MRAMKSFVCQAKVAFCPKRGSQTLLKAQLLRNDKVRPKLWRGPLVIGRKQLGGRKPR